MAAPSPSGAQIRRRHERIDVSARDLPVPAIARATLLAIGCRDAGYAEKVAWRVPFDFQGHPCVLEDQKLGVNIHIWAPAEWDTGQVAAFGDRALAAIRRAITVAEKEIFGPAIQNQVKLGQIILINNAGDLRRSYSYLRHLAQETLAPPELPVEVSDGQLQPFARHWNDQYRRSARRQTLTDAMIMAFFAYLERYLSLALAFSAAILEQIDLAEFLASGWREKYKTVLTLAPAAHKILYDKLTTVAETYRNPRAHGHDKKGSTTAVFLQNVGTVPVMLTGIEGTPAFRLTAYAPAGFADLTSLFADVEELMHGKALGNAAHWISSGLDVSLLEDDVQHYRAPKAQYLEYYAREREASDRSANYEW
jgi:hypothetical protein